MIHDLTDQLVTEQLGMAHVPGREVTESSATFVLMLYGYRLTRTRAAWDMLPLARLDARLLVGTDDQIVGVQWDPAPQSLVKIKHRPSLLFEPRGTGEDPAVELPGTNGILVQPPPDGGAADLGDDAPADSFGRPLSHGSSQASALILTTLSGGGNGRSFGMGTILQSEETQIEEPLAPSADDLPRDVQLQADGLVVESLSGEQYRAVYLREIRSSSRSSAGERAIWYGLVLGILPSQQVEHAGNGITERQRSQPMIRNCIYE